MNYESLVNYAKDIAENLTTTETIQFFHGRKEVLHELPEDPDGQTDNGILVWMLPMGSSGTFTEIGQQFNRDFTANFIIYKKDYQGSEIDQNDLDKTQDETNVIQLTDALAQEFIRNFNFNSINDSLQDDSETLEIQSVSTDTVIKDNDYLLTGTLINMIVRVPDSFNYCAVQNIIGVTYSNNYQTIEVAVADKTASLVAFQDMIPTLDPVNATGDFTFTLNGLSINASTGVITEGTFEDIPIGLNRATVSVVGNGDYGGSASFEVVLYKKPCLELLQTEYDSLTDRDDDVVYLICEP